MSDATRSGSADLGKLRITDTDRRRTKRRRRWPFVLGGIVLAALVLMMLMRPATVRVAPVRVGGGTPAETGGSVLSANGYVEARHQASVAARTTGRLAAVLVEEGDAVDSNAVVARLIDEDQRAVLMQTEANLALARARLAQAKAAENDADRRAKRRTELQGDNLISEEEGQSAETAAEGARADRQAADAGVKVAQANVESARLELDKTRITAPFAGVVLRKDAEVGEIVGPIMTSSTARAGAVVTIADMRTLEVGVDINESYIARLSVGMPADVVLDAHPEVHFPGEIRAIYPSADRDKATIPVRVRFLVPDERIRPDLGAKVTFLERRPTAEIVTVKKSLRIPASAVRARNGETVAWLVREGKAESVTISVGETQGADIEVISGLNEGDQVVIDGAARLHKGMRVKAAK
jgi:RND family efflux transporter MFP subunit